MSASPKAASTLRDYSTDHRVIVLSALAVVVGAVGTGLAWVLYKLIMLSTNLFYFGRFSAAFVEPAANTLGWKAIFIPVIGSLIVGVIARFGSDRIRGHGMPEAIEAVLLNGAKVQPKLTILKPLATAIAIGSGGPFGAEGPIIMTGGASGSLIGQMLRLTDAERSVMLVAGAAAGMSATFLAPLAAILLAVELFLFEWRPRSLVPVAVASVTAASLRRLILGVGPVFPMPVTTTVVPEGVMPMALLLGIVAGLFAMLLSACLYRCEDLFEELPFHWMWWPAIGGLAIGVGGYFFPPALGIGYGVIQQLLLGDFTWKLILGVLVVKSLIWVVSLSSGTSGGILAPLLMLGGALGAAMGMFVPALAPGAWVMVSMAAILAGAIGAPLTAAVLVVELTHNSGLLLPVLLACVAAYGCSALLQKRSILTERLSRRGYHLSREYGVDPLETVTVRQAMHTSVFALPADATGAHAADWLRSMEAKGPEAWSHWQRLFPVLDTDQRLLAVLTRSQMIQQARRGDAQQMLVSGAAADPVVVHAADTLRSAAHLMAERKLTHLPVVDAAGRLEGILTIDDLLQARERQTARESQRNRVLRVRWPFVNRDAVAAMDGEA